MDLYKHVKKKTAINSNCQCYMQIRCFHVKHHAVDIHFHVKTQPKQYKMANLSIKPATKKTHHFLFVSFRV